MAECDIIHNNNDNSDNEYCMLMLWGELCGGGKCENPQMDFIMLSIIVSMLFHFSMGELVSCTKFNLLFSRVSNFPISHIQYQYRTLFIHKTAYHMEKFGSETEDFSTK